MEGRNMGFIRNLFKIRKIKYRPFVYFRGDSQTSGKLEDSDIIGAIARVIGTNVGKLQPQIIRKDEKRGLIVKDDYLSRLISSRWSPELDAYSALYKMACDLVYNSNAYAVIFWTPDFTRVQSINPVTVDGAKIWEDENGNILFRFRWAYDQKEYTLPYSSVIHIRARFDKKRFIGTPPEQQVRSTLELLNYTGLALKNNVEHSSNLKGYLKYNNFADDEELKQKVKDFEAAYMSTDDSGGIAGLDNSMDFVQLTPQNTIVPATQAQFLRDNIYRYYGLNDKILTSTYSESDWNAFYESVIEPIALQLSLEFTYKLLSDRERGFGNKIIFTSNRLQYASLQTRMTIGGGMFDRGAITINELRELMYYGPVEGGDVRMVSLNYVKAADQSVYQVGQNADTTGSDAEDADSSEDGTEE